MEPSKEESKLQSAQQNKTRSAVWNFIAARQQLVLRKEIRGRSKSKWRPVLASIPEESVRDFCPRTSQLVPRWSPKSRSATQFQQLPIGARLERLGCIQLPVATSIRELPAATLSGQSPAPSMKITPVLQQSTTSSERKILSVNIAPLPSTSDWISSYNSSIKDCYPALPASDWINSFVKERSYPDRQFATGAAVPLKGISYQVLSSEAPSSHRGLRHNFMDINAETRRDTPQLVLQQETQASPIGFSPRLQQATSSSLPRRHIVLGQHAAGPAPPSKDSQPAQQLSTGQRNAEPHQP